MSSQGAEVWYEHKMSDGRVYFSHSVTRKTTWDRPQNAPIMPHPGQQSNCVCACACVRVRV